MSAPDLSARWYEALSEMPDREADRYEAAGLDPRARPSYCWTPSEHGLVAGALRTLGVLFEGRPVCDWCERGLYPAPPSLLCGECRADFDFEYEERAALREYVGGLSRQEAEALASRQWRAA